MPKALINPADFVYKIVSWETYDGGTNFRPTREIIENSHCITQIEDTEHEVASPLHWVTCNADVTVESFYFDSSDSTIKPINHATDPNPPPES